DSCEPRHVATDAVVPHRGRKPALVFAVVGLMAFQAVRGKGRGTRGEPLASLPSPLVPRLMRIVTGRACQRCSFLKALARPQVVNLVGDVVLFLALVEVDP